MSLATREFRRDRLAVEFDEQHAESSLRCSACKRSRYRCLANSALPHDDDRAGADLEVGLDRLDADFTTASHREQGHAVRVRDVEAEPVGAGPIQDFMAAMARDHGIWLIGGTLPLASPDPAKVINTTLVYNPQGPTLPPPQAGEMFRLPCTKPMRACAAAMRTSQAIASSAPPPRPEAASSYPNLSLPAGIQQNKSSFPRNTPRKRMKEAA